ncbi:MAG: hypothetical protein V3R28_02010, partial [Desulfatiglandales bacterium]
MNGIGFGRKQEKGRPKDHRYSDMEKKQVKAEGHKGPDTKPKKGSREEVEEIPRQELLEKQKETEEEAQKN